MYCFPSWFDGGVFLQFKSRGGKRFQSVVKRNISLLGDRTVNNEDSEDSPNLMGCSGSSSDSEVSIVVITVYN